MRIGLALSLALAAIVSAALVGCAGGGGGGNLPDPIVRYVNASPDSNPLDFHFDTDIEAPAIAYLGDSGEKSVDNGDHDTAIWDSVTQEEIDAIAFTYAKDKKYVAVALGLEFYGTELEKRLRVQAFEFNKNPPNGTKARLLILHGYLRETGFSTPAIDFQGGNVATYNPNNPQFKVTDIQFANSSPTELEVDAGVPLIFQARRAGTENVYASDPNFTFDSGGIYLVLVVGIENGAGAQAPQIKYIKIG
jgi:hypothetical protein